jgi:hypothetical protein
MKRLIIHALVLAPLVAALSGCYTQIGTLSYADDSTEKRSVVVEQSDSTADTLTTRSRTDTLVIRDERTRNCYWTRNSWGEPQLRCTDESTPFDSWYSYRYTPWWNRSFDSYYSHHGSCPAYYYYDPYTGTCRHRTDYSRCYDCYGRRSGGGFGGGNGSVGSGSSTSGTFERRSRGNESGVGTSGNAVYREPPASTSNSSKSYQSGSFERRERGSTSSVQQPSKTPAPPKTVTPSPVLQKADPVSSDAEDAEEQKRKELKEARERYLEYRRTKK